MQVGLSRLCSAAFEQLFAVLAPSSKLCLSEQLLSKNRFRAHIKREKVNDFIYYYYFFCLTDVSSYCEERKIKLLINVYIKISRNLGGNF